MDIVNMQKGANSTTLALKVVVKGPETLEEKGKGRAKEKEVEKEKAKAKVAVEEAGCRKVQQWW